MVLSGDLFNVLVFMEVAVISSYALVAFGVGPSRLGVSRGGGRRSSWSSPDLWGIRSFPRMPLRTQGRRRRAAVTARTSARPAEGPLSTRFRRRGPPGSSSALLFPPPGGCAILTCSGVLVCRPPQNPRRARSSAG